MASYRNHFTRRSLARTVLWGAVALVAIVPLAIAAQAQGAAQQGQGQSTSPPQVAAQRAEGLVRKPVGVRRIDTLPPISAEEIRLRPQPLPPLTGVHPATVAARKAEAARLRFATPRGSAAPAIPQRSPSSGKYTPIASVAVSSTNEGDCGNVTPADQALAVGDTNLGVLQVINVCYNVFDKSGVQQAGYPKSLTSLVGLPANTPTSHPRAIYDWINQRYIVAFIQLDPNFTSASSYWLAVSTGDSPAGSFCIYNFPVQSVAPSGGVFPLPDFPRLGQDREAIYLASNIFTNPTTYQWEEILALPKAQLYACQGQGFSFSFFFDLTLNGVPTDTTQPANFYSRLDTPRSEILVTSANIFFGGGQCSTGCNGLVVSAIHSPLNSPTLSSVFVPTISDYSLPPNASQPGAPNSIDTKDTRISGMVMDAAGTVYAALNTNGGSGQPAIFLYQIQPFLDSNGNLDSARILNEIFFGGGPHSWYYATQQPDPDGNVTTVYNFSNPLNFPGLAYSSRRVSQPVGSVSDYGFLFFPGQGLYSQGRWGSYTAVAPAGLNTTTPTMWFAGMYARSDGTWGTAIGRNGYTDISQ
jgi:hypothetical protein